MHPGIKLNCSWRESEPWARWNRAHAQPLAALRELGIESVEFSLWHRPQARRFSAQEEMDRVRAEASRFIEDGVRVHLHPYVHIDHRGPGHMTEAARGPVIEHLDLAVSLAASIQQEQHHPVTLVYHPADIPVPETCDSEQKVGEWRDELHRRSRAFFARAQACVAPHAGKIAVVCETQVPTNPRKIRIGDRPGELVDIARESGCRICWDTGHLLKSAEALGFEPSPPVALLERLGHVHLHAVVDGKDHHPATPENEYLQQCLGLMRAHGYDGCVTLEYNVARTPDDTPEQMRRVLQAGVDTVRAATDEGTNAGSSSWNARG